MVNSGVIWSRSQGSWSGPLWSQNWHFRWGKDFIRKSFKDFLCWFKFLFLNIFRTLRQMRRSLRITNISSTLSCDLAPGWDQATEIFRAKYSKEKISGIVFWLLVQLNNSLHWNRLNHYSTIKTQFREIETMRGNNSMGVKYILPKLTICLWINHTMNHVFFRSTGCRAWEFGLYRWPYHRYSGLSFNVFAYRINVSKSMIW